MIKGIIFDFGGTIDTNGIHWEKLLFSFYQKAGVEISNNEFHSVYVQVEKMLGNSSIIETTDTLIMTLQKKVELELLLIYSLSTRNNNNIQRELLINKIVHPALSFVKKNIEKNIPILEQLKQTYQLAMVTNYYGNVETVLKEFNLIEQFSVIVESQKKGIRKPNPEIFQIALEEMRLSSEEVLVVGDSYKNDILPAQFCGCKTLWINPEKKKSNEIINRIQEVPDLVVV